jgi:hypothetical protein
MRGIPTPQSNYFNTHGKELLLVSAERHDATEAGNVVEKRKWYGEEGINDREVAVIV